MKNRSETIGVRLSPEDKRLLESFCRDRDEDLSSFVRRLIRRELASRSYYPDEVKKALGVPREEAE